MRNTIINKLCELARIDKDVVLLTADLGFGALEIFEKEFPDRYINVGVAEQNMALIATGLALEGKKVFCYSISNFPTLRCLEQIRNGVCYHNLPVTIICMGAGIEYGALGATHHVTEDIAIIRSLPNIGVYSPCCADEVISCIDEIYQNGFPAYIRLNKSGAANVENKSTKISEITNYGETAVICTGTIIEEALKANKIIPIKIYSMPKLWPLDNFTKKKIIDICKSHNKVISLEEHQKTGGLGGIISEVIAESSVKTIFKNIGLNNEFTCKVGKWNELRKHYKINDSEILEVLK